MIDYLEWDSCFFEAKIGKIQVNDFFNLDDLTREMQELNYNCIYLLSPRRLDNKSVEHYLVDEKVVYQKELKKKENGSVYCQEYYGNITPELLDLAYLSGHESRFKKDVLFEPFFEKLYKRWLVSSLDRSFADIVLVKKECEKIIGFVTAKVKKNHAILGLIAVSENHQGKGVGKDLIIGLENLLVKQGVTSLEIATQKENKQACSFYEANAYSIKETTYIYHIR